MPATGEVHDVVLNEEVVDDAPGISSSEDEFANESYTNGMDSVIHTSLSLKPKKKATYQSIADKHHHEEFLRNCVEILLKEAVFEGTSRSKRVLEWHSPEELLRLFDFKLNRNGATHEELTQLVKDTIRYSVKTGHPYFVNQLFSSLDPYGLVGQWLTDALNPSVYTYEVSPVFTLMEEIVLREMRQIVGFEGGRGDGIFCPGGSLANGYAISCARYKFNPEIKVSE